MITFINQTKSQFKVRVEKDVENRNNKDNVKMTLSHGKMYADVYIPKNQVEEFKTLITTAEPGTPVIYEDKNRLYFSNKEYKPIIVSTKQSGANFLVLTHALEEKERVLFVEYRGAFALLKGFEKGDHISTVASFLPGRAGSITFITSNVDKVVTTTYACDSKTGKISVKSTEQPIEGYKTHDINKRGAITPFRPYRPTHLVFTLDKYIEDSKMLRNSNLTIVPVPNLKELSNKIEHYKGLGFKAATLFVGHDRGYDLSLIESGMLKQIQNNFRVAHLTYADEYTEFKSLKPVPPKPNPKKSGKKTPSHAK